MNSKPYCTHCQNTGWIDCHCGGDLCICENNGEEPCFYCEGDEDDDYEDDGQPTEAQEWRDFDPDC